MLRGLLFFWLVTMLPLKIQVQLLFCSIPIWWFWIQACTLNFVQAIVTSRTDGTSAGPEVTGDQLREKVWLGPMLRLDGAVGKASTLRAGDSASDPGLGDNFSIKLTISTT